MHQISHGLYFCVVNNQENQVTLELVVPARQHGNIMGTKGHRIQEITRDHNVQVKFPDRKAEGTPFILDDS